MALKRKRAFRAFGWDLGDRRNRSAAASSRSCFDRSNLAMLFGHTFFDQMVDTKSVLCSMPHGDAPACSCCTGLQTLRSTPSRGAYRLESTGGSGFSSPSHFQMLEGCNDYQLFWD